VAVQCASHSTTGNGAEEMAENMILQCPTHAQMQQETWPDL